MEDDFSIGIPFILIQRDCYFYFIGDKIRKMRRKLVVMFLVLGLVVAGYWGKQGQAEDKNWVRIGKDNGSWMRLGVYGQGKPIGLKLSAEEGAQGQTKIRIYKIGEDQITRYLAHDDKYNQIFSPISNEGLEKEGELTAEIGKEFNLPIETVGWRLVEAEREGVKDQVIIGINGMGTTAKAGKETIVLWNQNFSDRKSIKGGQVRVYNLRDRVEVIQETTVDESGLAIIRNDTRADMVVVEHEGEKTVTPLNETTLNQDWYYNWNNFGPYRVGTKSFVFTDRPIYKAGDKLYFKAILRADDDGRYQVAAGTAEVKISRGWGENEQRIFERKLTIDTDGTVDGEAVIPETAKAGYYTVTVDKDGSSNSVGIRVEEYRKPEYVLSTEAARQEVVRGDKLEMTIKGEYFSGQALAGEEVEYKIYASRYDWEWEYYYDRTDKDYYRAWGGEKIETGTVKLDQKGEARLVIDSNKNDSGGNTQTFSVEVGYTDKSGIVAMSGKNFLVKAGEYSIYRQDDGYRPVRTGEMIKLPLMVKANRDGLGLSHEVKITAVRKWWEEKKDENQKYSSWQEKEEKIGEWQKTSDSNGNIDLEIEAKDKGSYIFTAEMEDGMGNKIVKEFGVWVSDYDYWWDDGFQGQISVSKNKEEYEVGETAKIRIESEAGGDVFWTAERAYVYRYGVVSLTDGGADVEIVIEEDDMPNTFVTARSFDGEKLIRGTAKLKINTDQKQMRVRITLDKESYGPGEEVTLNVTTEDQKGNGVVADVAVWAVDKAIFELADRNFGDVFGYYWSERYGNAPESDSLAGIWGSAAEKGGGGDGDGGREHFADTAFWQASIKTDGSGRAKVSFKLPDNLTTWVMTGIAANSKTEVGEATAELKVSKEVVVRPVLPNILREGDRVFLTAMINNHTEMERNFEVGISLPEELELESKQKSDILVPANSYETAGWWVKVVKEGMVKAEYSAYDVKDKKMGDKVRLPIEIQAYGYWEKNSDFKIGGDSFEIAIPDKTDVDKSKVSLEVASSLMGTLPSAMKYLLHYPYGCVEQTTSSLVPLLVAKTDPKLFAEAIGDKDIDDMVKKGLVKLRDDQNSDGGWGWWGGRESDVFMTTYVVETVAKAKDLGYEIDIEMWNNARDFLARNYDQADNTNKVLKAWGLGFFEGKENKKIIETDFSGLDNDVLALAVMNNIRAGVDVESRNGLTILMEKAVKAGNLWYWEGARGQRYSSNAAATGGAIKALVASGKYKEEAAGAVKYLTNSRNRSYWYNTFGTGQVITAIMAQSKGEAGKKDGFRVLVDGEVVESGVSDGTVEIAVSELKSASSLRVESENPDLYLTLTTELWIRDDDSNQIDRGITINREYISERGENYSLAPGDTVEVKLTVKMDEVGSGDVWGSNYGYIEDFLPAGMVPINTHLKNERYDANGGNYGYWGYEFKKDGVVIPVWRMENGTYSYLARVIAAGDYKAPPAVAGLMYMPEIWGRTDFAKVQIDQEAKVLWTKKIEEQIEKPSLSRQIVMAVIGTGGLIYLLKIKRKNKSEKELDNNADGGGGNSGGGEPEGPGPTK